MSNNIPSINPADNDSLAGTLQFAYNKLLQQTDGMLPAQVVSYDRATNRASVQLLISLITTSGALVPRAQLASVPVLILGGGGFSLSFPLQEGDLGWVIANDRDISLFLQEYTQSQPNSFRIKQFSDGMFIPDVMKSWNSNSGNESDFIIQNETGTISISMTATSIDIKAPVSVTITTPVLAVVGNITATGTITPGV